MIELLLRDWPVPTIETKGKFTMLEKHNRITMPWRKAAYRVLSKSIPKYSEVRLAVYPEYGEWVYNTAREKGAKIAWLVFDWAVKNERQDT